MYRKILAFLFSCALTFFSVNSYARTYNLTLVDNGVSTQIPLEDIRKQSNLEFTIYEPFKEKNVQIKGIYLDDLLMKYLSKVPKDITLYAIDDYETKFSSWKKKHWIVVTYEDGKTLSVRSRGPLKVVEKEMGDKDPKNLRDFNDWVWMLNKIEVTK